MKKGWLPLFLAFCLFALPALGEAEILYPSEGESTIAAGRDFYVIARVPEGASEGAVRLFDAEGNLKREIRGTDASAFNREAEGFVEFNADDAHYLMPDIIYDPARPDSLWDGSIKCYLKNGYLFAMIPGGRYEMAGRAIVDGSGAPYAALEEGNYTLEVEAGGEKATRALTLGVTQDKVMARFSPTGHLKAVKSVKERDSLRAYFDPLPGYWSPSSFLDEEEGNAYFSEIKERWQLADAMEYEDGTVHFFIYNLSPSSATVRVELGRLQADGAIDSERLKMYYYDIGEPLLGYAEAETDVYLMGTLTRIEQGDRLAFTRAEETDEAEENVCVVYEGEPRPIDVDFSDGVSVSAGKALTLFGVVTPIQNEKEDLSELAGSAWRIDNRIAEIEYALSCGSETWTERKPVALLRTLAPGWVSESIGEFAHVFTFAQELSGQAVTLETTAYDEKGAPVPGCEETLTVFVK